VGGASSEALLRGVFMYGTLSLTRLIFWPISANLAQHECADS